MTKDPLSFPSHASAERARALLDALRLEGPVVGTDEAGRGPLAGPVVAAAVWLTPEQERSLAALGLQDSKRMTAKSREAVFAAMNEMGVLWRAQAGSVERIERDNILQAALWAMGQSVLRLSDVLPEPPRVVVVDGTARIPGLEREQWPLVSADALVPAVSAASVAAKVIRDRIMLAMDKRFPGYGFAQHKGYATKAHREAVRRLGLSPIHRESFCRKLLPGQDERPLTLFPLNDTEE